MDDSVEINEFFDKDFYEDEDDDDAKEEKDNELNKLLDKENKHVRKITKSRPQPKLNEARLTGPKGIQALRESFKSFKPDLTKDPYDILDAMLDKYEYWAHCMFPKMKFEDVVSRCEQLGEKRAVKVYMTKSRLDMPLTDEDFAPPQRLNRNEIIDTENNEEDLARASRRSESDDEENFYEPLQFFSKGRKERNDTLGKSVLSSNIPQASSSLDMENDIIESAFEAKAIEMQNELKRREEEELAIADEIMADFDI